MAVERRLARVCAPIRDFSGHISHGWTILPSSYLSCYAESLAQHRSILPLQPARSSELQITMPAYHWNDIYANVFLTPCVPRA
jgi:hypothetical protein